MRRFSTFACIDWSGAAVEYTRSLAVAITQGPADVTLLHRPKGWSRPAIADWLLGLAETQADMLVGLDLSPAFPFHDVGAYFPQWDASPDHARGLWALVEQLCTGDMHLAANGFLAHPEAARHFRQRGQQGEAFIGSMGRLRVVESGQAAMGLRPTSCFNLVGAAQVGKSSLTGMRVLHRLAGRIPVWPFDPVPARGPVLVEIYTSLAALAAGRSAGRSKVRSDTELIAVLDVLGASISAMPTPLTDHAADALMTAAWLRNAAADPDLWHPAALTSRIAETEGWTFGVR